MSNTHDGGSCLGKEIISSNEFYNFRYDRGEPIHLLVLQSLYSRMMGGPLSCPSLGDHWTDIGFNHADPSIDLSSAKMLGAISLLFFVTQYSAISEEGMF